MQRVGFPISNKFKSLYRVSATSGTVKPGFPIVKTDLEIA
ncbi:hypothetical protein A2U01_0055454, partial [Trifolium medium]|nr:hypothetical protein [Trifolium medium]